MNKGVLINADVEERLLKQMHAYRNELLCVSVVVNGNILDIEKILKFVEIVNDLKIAVSLTCYNWENVEDIKSLKNEVSQIRMNIGDNVVYNKLPELFMQLKTSSNNVVFLFEIAQLNELEPYIGLLDSNELIYNISYNPSISYDSYWTLARYVGELKRKYPLKIFQEFTCAGVTFKNIGGLCPAKTSLMCVDINGNVKYCFKDNFDHGLSIFDDGIDKLFDLLGKGFPNCSVRLCDDDNYQICQGGCPLDSLNEINKYCIYNKKED